MAAARRYGDCASGGSVGGRRFGSSGVSVAGRGGFERSLKVGSAGRPVESGMGRGRGTVGPYPEGLSPGSSVGMAVSLPLSATTEAG
jgi:hypothetical protein